MCVISDRSYKIHLHVFVDFIPAKCSSQKKEKIYYWTKIMYMLDQAPCCTYGESNFHCLSQNWTRKRPPNCPGCFLHIWMHVARSPPKILISNIIIQQYLPHLSIKRPRSTTEYFGRNPQQTTPVGAAPT